jgi:hypothetical protein
MQQRYIRFFEDSDINAKMEKKVKEIIKDFTTLEELKQKAVEVLSELNPKDLKDQIKLINKMKIRELRQQVYDLILKKLKKDIGEKNKDDEDENEDEIKLNIGFEPKSFFTNSDYFQEDLEELKNYLEIQKEDKKIGVIVGYIGGNAPNQQENMTEIEEIFKITGKQTKNYKFGQIIVHKLEIPALLYKIEDEASVAIAFNTKYYKNLKPYLNKELYDNSF